MTDCTSPPEVANGYVAYESLSNGPLWTNGESVLYKCFKFYGLVDSDRLTCSSGTWTGTTPKCEYHQDTEIVFSFLLAMVIILVIVVVALLIFVCCYFCKKRASGHGNRNRIDSSGSGGKRRGYKPV